MFQEGSHSETKHHLGHAKELGFSSFKDYKVAARNF